MTESGAVSSLAENTAAAFALARVTVKLAVTELPGIGFSPMFSSATPVTLTAAKLRAAEAASACCSVLRKVAAYVASSKDAMSMLLNVACAETLLPLVATRRSVEDALDEGAALGACEGACEGEALGAVVEGELELLVTPRAPMVP
jgi:hypothetical protein